MKHLIIVESPTKAKTIKSFLGKDYEIIASKGHIRDLPKHTFGIQIEQEHFNAKYVIPKESRQIVAEIKELAQKADDIFIATDEDREGEAIGYHIAIAIGKEPLDIPRIVFHEITKTAITKALENPRKINISMVHAQQTRRFLDRIVGYKLSPLLASKIHKGLSAGRVQSSALKIIIDREKEIQAFVPIQYFSINAFFNDVEATIYEYHNKKIGKMDIRSEEEAKKITEEAKNDSFIVSKIEYKSRKVSPPPPFMTSTLQQSASSQLGFAPSKTMRIAQKLYEGMTTHEGITGLITYMRTDSLNIAQEALHAVRKLITQSFGETYLPSKPNIYTTKSKNAQEAHEAIRPTNINFTPQVAADFLESDDLKLYTLIYNRFVASQMNAAEFEIQNIFFQGNNVCFKANGRKLIFDGFYAILGNDDKDKLLPTFEEHMQVQLQKIKTEEHFTEPPPRYSEASLIKTLESLGIGRPSTYAPTITLLSQRHYIIIEKKQLIPQEIAFRVMSMLESNFNEIVDSNFSADMEEKLDSIAQNEAKWEKVLWNFYYEFDKKIQDGKTNIKSQKVIIPTGELCPKCGCELVKRESKYGEFVACSGYPKCKYIQPNHNVQEAENGEKCEKCQKPMVVKFSKRGKFLACSGYPECKNTKSLTAHQNTKTIDIKCPKCNGDIVQRFSKRGAFFGCSQYPQCDFISKFEPIDKKCNDCGSLMAERMYRGKEVYECISCKTRIPKDNP